MRKSEKGAHGRRQNSKTNLKILKNRNTYSALNAVAGHYNSFGSDTPLPKKRLDRVMKELDDADKLLGRGR